MSLTRPDGRLTRVPPLPARVQPIPGETLLSLVARAADANVFPKLADLLGHAGIGGHPAFAPFTAADRPQPLAELLGVPVAEVAARFHPLHPDQSLKDARIWAGIRMRRRSIEARSRRVAPLALKSSPHHRLEWTHRALSFCPETLQQLISRCPACAAELGWVTTKGLDRCETCEASLTDAPAVLVTTRSPERLIGAARLISPDPTVRAAALALLPAEFHAWDAGDLFSALCEVGVAWRKPGQRRGSATARALSDGSYDFTPEDIGRGYVLMREWPQRSGELLDRLAAEASSHRTNGRLTSTHLGVLGRHLGPVSTGPTLGGLLARAVEAEAQARRVRAVQARDDQADLDRRLIGSIGLVEACKEYKIGRPVLNRLVFDGGSLIAAQSRRRGGVRFDRAKLEATIQAYNSAESFTAVAQKFGPPRYCLPAFIKARVLEAVEDPDVERLFGCPAVTAQSASHLQQRLERGPSFGINIDMDSLAGALRRRFDPVVWAEAFRLTASDLPILFASYPNEVTRNQIMAWVFVNLEELYERLPEDDLNRIDRTAKVSAQEAGRLLGLSSAHLPELFDVGILRAERSGLQWDLALGDVMDFRDLYVTGAEVRQRIPDVMSGDRPFTPQIDDFEDVIRTRHFKLCSRELFEQGWCWPDENRR